LCLSSVNGGLAQRIVRYAELVGKENVIAGSDCGFRTFARTNYQAEPEIVRAKFKAMSEGARLTSEQLWA
jgi:5-methyltetrahydropteroyltriglutamate--homocysteine methyltransferase